MSSVRSTLRWRRSPDFLLFGARNGRFGANGRRKGFLGVHGRPVIRYEIQGSDHSSLAVERALRARRPRFNRRRGSVPTAAKALRPIRAKVARDEHDARAPVLARPGFERDRR